MVIIEFDKNFKKPNQKYLGTVKQGEEDYPKLDKLIKETSSQETILLDIDGFDLFGYSYAKQTIRKVIQMAKAGLYDHRYFLLKAKDKEYTEEVSTALSQIHLSMICSLSRDPKMFYKKYFVIGGINELQKITLDYIINKKEVTSGQMNNDLKLDSVQSASNRIRKLADERLVRWEESPDRVRNVLSCRRIEI